MDLRDLLLFRFDRSYLATMHSLFPIEASRFLEKRPNRPGLSREGPPGPARSPLVSL